MEITLDKLKRITGIKDQAKLDSLLDGLKEVMVLFKINSTLRMSHFLAQLMHESNDFTAVKENLNYSAEALLKTWPKQFTAATAKECARNPVKIGNRAYDDRMGNGNYASGDGYKFRGRGYIQCTGRDNYKAAGKALGLDLITHPELLEQPKYALLSAAWFWDSRKLNAVADKALKDVTAVTKIVNGAYHGLADRQSNFNSIYKILS